MQQPGQRLPGGRSAELVMGGVGMGAQVCSAICILYHASWDDTAGLTGLGERGEWVGVAVLLLVIIKEEVGASKSGEGRPLCTAQSLRGAALADVIVISNGLSPFRSPPTTLRSPPTTLTQSSHYPHGVLPLPSHSPPGTSGNTPLGLLSPRNP